MAGALATTAIVPGQRLTIEIGGSIPVYLPDSAFREDLTNQLRMQGLDVERVDVTSSYGFTSRDYKAIVVAQTLAPSKVSSVIAQAATAAENAGSYSPTATIPSIGQAAQADIKKNIVEQTVGDLLEAIGVAGKNVAKAPEEFFSTTKLIVIGLVVIAGFIALGPNLRGLGRVR